MPLNKSGSEESVGENIRTEMHAHPEMAQKQAIAIAENVKREAQKHGDNEGCPFGATDPMKTHGSATDELHPVEVEHCVEDSELPFGGKAPGAASMSTMDYGYKDGDPVGAKHGGYSAVSTPESLTHNAKQMWSEAASASEKESNNGVVTPEA